MVADYLKNLLRMGVTLTKIQSFNLFHVYVKKWATFMSFLALPDFSKEILTIQNLTKTVLLDGVKYFAWFMCDTFQIDFLMFNSIYTEDLQFIDDRKKYW